jgi:cytochrome c553
MLRKSVLATGTAVALGLAACMPAAHAVDRGTLLASTCNTCHGPDGRGAGAIPNIQGRPPAAFIAVMNSFKAGGAPTTTVMDRHAKGHTEEDIKQMADHYAKLGR